MNPVQYKITPKLGPLYLVASEKGLKGIHFERQAVPLVKSLDRSLPAHQMLNKASLQLTEYFSGQRKSFDIPLDLEGTPFQRQVWNQLAKIPFGRTVSYRDVAQRIKNPKAVRAVGSANGKNPVCIVIPCHRVIAADGSIGGYSGGLSMKKKLLALEKLL